jgi:hypothetical protein
VFLPLDLKRSSPNSPWFDWISSTKPALLIKGFSGPQEGWLGIQFGPFARNTIDQCELAA